MAISINCRGIGADCDHSFQGSTVDELIQDAGNHAVRVHSYPEEFVSSVEWIDQMRALIRNSSRPAYMTGSSPPIPPPPGLAGRQSG